MTGDTPGKRRGALLVYVCLGSAFVLNTIFFTVDRLGALQTAAASQAVHTENTDPTDSETAKSFGLRIFKETDRVKLKGYLPSEEDHKTVLGLVKAAFPANDLVDRVKIDEHPASSMMKVGGVTFALKALTYLHTGSALVDGVSVTLEGEVKTDAVYDEVQQFIKTALPTGVTLKAANISAPPKSFVWRVEVQDGQVIIHGAMPSEDTRQAVQNRAKSLFSGLQLADHTNVAEGAPEGWAKAALHSLAVLQLLQSGFVQMTDQSIRVDGIVTDEGKLSAIDHLADKYPSGFSLESHVGVPVKHGTEATGVLSMPQATASER